MNLPTSLGNKLQADFIHQGQWRILWQLQQHPPLLCAEISSIKLPNHESLLQSDVVLQWPKLLRNKSIPPSRTFMLWRLIYVRLPTDDLLRKRGLFLTSTCCHCNAATESSNHLFINYNLAQKLWRWLGTMVNLDLSSTSPIELFQLCIPKSPQVSGVILARITYVIWQIWSSRNVLCFDNNKIFFEGMITNISNAIAISDNITHTCLRYNDQDRHILGAFNLEYQSPLPWHINSSGLDCTCTRLDESEY